MIAAIRQGLKDEGFDVSLSQLCRWFELPRRTQYYRPTKAPPVVKPELAGPVKALIEAEPSFGYRTVAGLLGMNKNTVQRKHWRLRGLDPRFRCRSGRAAGACGLIDADRASQTRMPRWRRSCWAMPTQRSDQTGKVIKGSQRLQSEDARPLSRRAFLDLRDSSVECLEFRLQRIVGCVKDLRADSTCRSVLRST